MGAADSVSGTRAQTAGGMPAGVWNAHFFQVFNTMSFLIVLGMPIILYFKHLDATATLLGVVVALNPLLNILQIPAAKFMERIGYRTFVLRGWATRSFFIVGMAVVALLPEGLDRSWRIGLMLAMLVAFNAARGVSACGFLPWMTHLVPEAVRGRFLARDQIAIALAMFGTLILTAMYLTGATGRYAYPVMFFGSYAAALVSLAFLRRIPDVPVPHGDKAAGPVPWKDMLLHPPFLRLMFYNVTVYAALAAATVFWAPLLRDHYGATDGKILGIQALASGVMVVSLLVFGRHIDRVGSRPLLGLSGLTYVVHFGCWGALAARCLPFNLKTILLIQVTAGLAASLFNLANTRLVMSTVPQMGRSHFFAMFSVITNVTLGSLPVVWGAGLDAVGDWRAHWGAWEWNQYSLLYAALTAIMLLALYLCRHLSEPRAMTTDAFLQELVLKTPGRALSRLLLRRPF
ncbi:MAG: MFS transporter [Verrucomicrobiia bacterium]|jgi:MFS family permease